MAGFKSTLHRPSCPRMLCYGEFMNRAYDQRSKNFPIGRYSGKCRSLVTARELTPFSINGPKSMKKNGSNLKACRCFSRCSCLHKPRAEMIDVHSFFRQLASRRLFFTYIGTEGERYNSKLQISIL